MHTLHKYRFVSGFRLEALLPWPVLVFFFQISNYLRLFLMAFGCPRALVMTELKPTEYFLCCLFCQLFMTKNRIILTKQSGRPLKLKVVIRCRKK